MEHKEHIHGSDLEKMEQVYGVKKEEVTGFGANVNPLGLSPLLKASLAGCLNCLSTYPDREYTALRKAIGLYAGCDYHRVLVGNGSTELISLFIRYYHPQNALVIGPTYSEYEREILLSGGKLHYHDLPEENGFQAGLPELEAAAVSANADLLILCNPNNPTSGVMTREFLHSLLLFCMERDIFVMIDETYVEFAPDPQAITAICLTLAFRNLIVLRGISKFFAAPGLRLGYAVTGNAALQKAINEAKNPWSINSLAEAAGRIMFTDTEYIDRTRNLIQTERERICQRLSEIGRLKFYTPVANFILVRSLDVKISSLDVFEAAIRERMLIRDCATFHSLDDSYFRFCIMLPEDNERLLLLLERLFA